MEELQNVVQHMDTMEMIYWGTAIVATVVFCIQTIMLFVGFDADADFSGGDVEFDNDGMNLVSVKTVVCFLLGFGWTGVIGYPITESKGILAGVAVAVGVAFMFLIALLLKQVLRLSKDNTFSTHHVVGATAEVYLRIPGGKDCGKITVSHEGSLHELLAMADAPIATGQKVKIVDVIDESSVRVAPIAPVATPAQSEETEAREVVADQDTTAPVSSEETKETKEENTAS